MPVLLMLMWISGSSVDPGTTREQPGAALRAACAVVTLPALEIPDDVQPDGFADAIRDGLVEALAKAGVDSRTTDARDAETCVEVTSRLSVKHKRGSSWLKRAVIDAAAAAAWQAPVSGIPGVVVGAAVSSAAASMSTAAATVKAHDDIRLDVSVASAGRPVLEEWVGRAKARGDADDVFTPLVESAAKAVVAALATR